MKFNEIEIKVIDFVSEDSIAFIEGGGDGSGPPL